MRSDIKNFSATFGARFPLLATHWLPLLSYIALIIACLDSEREAYNLPRAHLLSRVVYGGFLGLCLLLLWLRSTRASGKPPVVQSSIWWWLDVMACTYLFVTLMQQFIPAPRPDNSPIQGLYGFPSAHEVSTWALAWLIFEAQPRFAPFAFGLAVLIGWARLEAHAHFPYQVLAGAALGMALGWWESHHSGGILLPRCLALFGRKQTQKVARKAARKATRKDGAP